MEELKTSRKELVSGIGNVLIKQYQIGMQKKDIKKQ